MKFNWEKVGHKRPRQGPISILLVFIALLLFNFVWPASQPLEASQQVQSGQVDVNALVPLTQAAVITVPHNGQHFSQTTITVSGTCFKAIIVEIYKNNIFAGSTLCSSGEFTLQISLLLGKNVLVAKVRDIDGNYGPSSHPVTVYYDQIIPLPVQGQQFILTTDGLYTGTKVGESAVVTINLIGGFAPYTLEVDWGEGNRDLISRPNNGSFNATHTYGQQGSYQIRISGVDSIGQRTFVQTTIIVSGAPQLGSTVALSTTENRILRALSYWYVELAGLVLLAAMIYWLGFRHATYRDKFVSNAPLYKPQQKSRDDQNDHTNINMV